MSVSIALADGVQAVAGADGDTHLKSDAGELNLGPVGAATLSVLRGLARGYPTYESLTTDALTHGGIDALRSVHELLDTLFAHGWLVHRVRSRSQRVMTVVPVSGRYGLDVRKMPAGHVALSRFAFVRRDGVDFVIECATAHARAVIHDHRVLTLLWSLTSTASKRTTLSPGVARAVLDVLWSAGFLDVDHESLIQWEFHDLLFHSRSRRGRHAGPYGATFRLRDRIARPSAHPPQADDGIPLARPDLSALETGDWTLTRALETRRSRRTHGPVTITREQLAEFLFRTAAVREGGDVEDTSIRRVYPSGGATYPLEIYVASRACDRLEAGLYHYRADLHQLHPTRAADGDVQALIAQAGQAGACASPQLLILIAARFERVSWKYSSLSYALILKEVGALMQTMYLVATAMGLCACAVGGGDSDLFAKAAGAGYYDEGTVGELLLGACPDDVTTYSRSPSAPSKRPNGP